VTQPNEQTEEAAPASATEPPALKTGDVCGGYVIDELLASGGMAQVYRAHHEMMRRVVAVKVLSERYRGRPDIRTRTISEARALAEIDHANVVRILHAGEDDKFGPYIVMELLEGKTLRQLMRWGGPMPLLQGLTYGIEIADATDALHRLGIIHRDLKPDNVFVTKEPRILKLLDLGAAKVEKYGNRTTGNFQTIGTAAYMSPEHLDAKKITAASDVYSLGHVIFEMIAGDHAFLVHDAGAPTPENFARWQRFATPERLNKVVPAASERTARALAQALEKDPDRRFPTMKAFADALRAAFRDELAARDAKPEPPAEPDAPKGKFGTELMVPKLSVAEIKARAAAKQAQAAAAGAHGTMRMPVSPTPPHVVTVSREAVGSMPSLAVASSSVLADAGRTFQGTPPPLTVDDSPRAAPKIAAAVLAGLLIAVLAFVAIQFRARSSASEAPRSASPGISAPVKAVPLPPPSPTASAQAAPTATTTSSARAPSAATAPPNPGPASE
jgi:serine/threonine-protein kinase